LRGWITANQCIKTTGYPLCSLPEDYIIEYLTKGDVLLPLSSGLDESIQSTEWSKNFLFWQINNKYTQIIQTPIKSHTKFTETLLYLLGNQGVG
jgi:hypothetical protein